MTFRERIESFREFIKGLFSGNRNSVNHNIPPISDSVRSDAKEVAPVYQEAKEERSSKDGTHPVIDYKTLSKLEMNYGFKREWLTEKYGINDFDIQKKAIDIENYKWLESVFSSSDKVLLCDMLHEHKSVFETENGETVYFLNNRSDDCAVIFLGIESIRCFFMDQLPKDIQTEIIKTRLNCLSFEELEVLSAGSKFTLFKKAYFCPSDPGRFHLLARERGLSEYEYCSFLTGLELETEYPDIDDEKIIDLFNSYYSEGKLNVPSDFRMEWFWTFLEKTGLSVNIIASMYGFETERETKTKELETKDLETTQEAIHNTEPEDQERDVKDFETIEEDMKPYEIETEDGINKIFAKYPLVGNKILSEKTKEKLYTNTKVYIDKKLHDSQIKLPMKAKKQIALQVITFAKEWDSGDESSFWKYIAAQFGYRDEANQLRSILCNCVRAAMVNSRRWFVAANSTYQYKATIVVHALSTKQSWMRLYDYLFDFYKTNMEWSYIENDPLITSMVIALRSKLIAEEDSGDNIEISAKVYSFQEGIRKLIIYRTGYAIKLIDHMLRRIDAIMNHAAQPAKQYVDVLCDQWMEERIRNSGDSKHGAAASTSRSIAIDYTRIRPLYVLLDNNTAVISLPDIRLKKTEFERVELQVYTGDINVETKPLSYYGNELGKTLNGFDIDLDMCLRRGDGTLNIRIRLFCDEEEIYDSKDTLYRDCICFQNNKERDIKECTKASYVFFTTKEKEFDFSSAEVSEIDTKDGFSAFYAKLEQGFLVKLDGQIVAFDSAEGSTSISGIKVVSPSLESDAFYIKNGQRYSVLSKEPKILLIVQDKDKLNNCAVTVNSKGINVNSIIPDETGKGFIYMIPLHAHGDGICEYQVSDIEKRRMLARGMIKIIPGFKVEFNRDFYFVDKDFRDAYVRLSGLQGSRRYTVSSNDSIISIPDDNGIIEVKVPRVTVRNGIGQKWENGYTAWIKDIKQSEKVYVSAPQNCQFELKVGQTKVYEESKGCFGFGNAVLAQSGVQGSDWLDILVTVSGLRSSQEYSIGRISPIERFEAPVQFNYRDNTLFWNHGRSFIGNKDRQFKLRIITEEGNRDYPLNLDDETAIASSDLPLNEYKYQIIKESESIFMADEEVVYSGTLLIGDKNALRFQNSMIKIESITYERGGDLRSVSIRNTHINRIEYEGVQFIGSEDRECPVYRGVMFYMGKDMIPHDFSFIDSESDNGILIYKLNPVKIIYINEHTLSITNEDDDGIYYYRYFDKDLMANYYSITDREPTKKNENMYHLADLFTYSKERTL